MAISRLYNHAAGDLIEASEINEEFNQLISEVNAKPDADTTLQTNLNADLLDGYHADAAGVNGTIPVSNGTLMTGLNADKLDGYHAADLIGSAFDTGTKMIFVQASPPGGWTEVTPTSGHVWTFVWGTDSAFNQAFWRKSTSAPTAKGETTTYGNTGTGWDYTWGVIDTAVDLDISALPYHSHNIIYKNYYYQSGASVLRGIEPAGGGFDGYVTSGASGSGDGSATTADVYATFGFNSWRPPRTRVIVAEKD